MGIDVTDESHHAGEQAWHAEAMRTEATADDLLGLFPPGTRTDGDGTIVVGGCRLDEVADEFGTPAIVVAEDALRNRARNTSTRSAAGGPAATWRSRRSHSRAPRFSG